MDSSQLRRGYTVDMLAWSLAIGSVLLIAGVVFGIFRLSAATYQSLALTNFEKLMADSRYLEVRGQLGRFFERAPVVGFVQRGSTLAPKELRALCEGLLDALNLFRDRAFPAFYDNIRKLSSYRPLLADYPSLKKSWSEIEQAAQQGDVIFREVEALQVRIGEVNAELRGTTDQYNLLARDVSELFSLRVSGDVTPGVLPPFYRAGVLAGLPTIRGISDDIPSLEELRGALEQAGGKVNVSGPDIAQIFNEKLQNLRQTGSAIFDKFVELNKEFGDLKQKSEKLQGNLGRLGDRTDSLSRRFFQLVLTTPGTQVTH